jgi:hypothetical protein
MSKLSFNCGMRAHRPRRVRYYRARAWMRTSTFVFFALGLLFVAIMWELDGAVCCVTR